VVLLFGTVVCLSVEFTVSLPALVALIARAVAELGAGLLPTLDGGVLIVVLLIWQVMWCARWWARHHAQVWSLVTRYRKAGREVQPHGG
jgi:hypothetical protein